MTTPLGSRYELVEKIASGATGSVWRARVVATGEAVAAKQIRAELATDADVVDRFLRERRVLTSIQHPAVVRVRDLVVEGDQISLVMDLVDGADLRHTLAAAATLAPTSAVLMAATIADALAAAHAAGVVHADVKPANVLVPADGGPVRLADFGVSRLVRGPAKMSYGTPEYIAPEVVGGHASIPASDVYGLGILLYELLTGVTPYRGGSSAEVMKRHLNARPIWTEAVPDAVRPVLSACLHRDPARRPAAETLAADLRAVAPELAGLPASAPLPAGTPHFQVVPVVESVAGGVEPDERVTSVLPSTPRVEALVLAGAQRQSGTLSLPSPELVSVGAVYASSEPPNTPGWDSPAPGGWSGSAAPGGPTPGGPTPGGPTPTSGGPAPTNVYPAASGPSPTNVLPTAPGPGGPGAPGTPSFDDTLSPPRWAFPAGTIPPRTEPKKRRWPLIVGLVVVAVLALVAIGVGVAWSGVLSSDNEKADPTPTTQPSSQQPSQQPTTKPSPSAGQPSGQPTDEPGLPIPGETMTPPGEPMPSMPSSGSGGPEIGQPIN